jgi:hypothetical protein
MNYDTLNGSHARSHKLFVRAFFAHCADDDKEFACGDFPAAKFAFLRHDFEN